MKYTFFLDIHNNNLKIDSNKTDSRFLIRNCLTHLRSTLDRSKLLPATVSLLLSFSLSHEKGERRIVETITELSDEQGVQYAILSGATVFIIAFEAISLVEKIHPKGMMDPIVSSIFYILCFDPEHFVTGVSRLIEKLQIANPNMAP